MPIKQIRGSLNGRGKQEKELAEYLFLTLKLAFNRKPPKSKWLQGHQFGQFQMYLSHWTSTAYMHLHVIPSPFGCDKIMSGQENTDRRHKWCCEQKREPRILLSVTVFKELFREKTKDPSTNSTVTQPHRLIETLVTMLALHHSMRMLILGVTIHCARQRLQQTMPIWKNVEIA